MSRWTNKFWMVAAVLIGSASMAASASAQRLNPSQTPNYGTRAASPGFQPDPITVSITSGGTLNVANMGLAPGCTGYATEAPDFRFNLTGGSSSFLRFFVDAGAQDTTLVINKPDGTWVCNDDISTSNRNPQIDLRNAPPGQYDIWVGSYRSGIRARGTLGISELPSSGPGGGGGGGNAVSSGGGSNAGRGALNYAGTPNFGSMTIASGFTPDPRTAQLTSGGAINAENAGLPAGCNGWVSANPDFNIVLTSNSSFLRIYATGGDDTTLVINDAGGTWHCNDDSYGGTNPSVDLMNAGPGTYNVWLGSYRQGQNSRATLNVTELQSAHP